MGRKVSLITLLFDDILRFHRCLRTAEYWYNNRTNNVVARLLSMFHRYRLMRQGRKLGFSIPVNVFGPGLSIAHAGTIVVNKHAKVGRNCRLHVCVNIGAATNNSEAAPQIGDDCYIAPGAKLYGGIVIGDNTGIGANAVVTKSFPEGNQTLGGIPAKVIANRGPKQFRPDGTDKDSI